MANLPENWCVCSLDDVLSYEQPQPYIVKNANYSDDYKIPVLTAGKSFIIGYTKEETGVYDKLPAIIFDDFTTSSKIVNFKFKVKSSAMKILKPRLSELNLHFFYYLMQTIKCNHNTHKRYWISDFSQKEILFPPLAEQERIVQKIEELFAEIDAGIENLKIVKNQIKLYRQSVLKNAFDHICAGSKLIKDVCEEIKVGIVIKPAQYYTEKDDGIRAFRSANVREFRINNSNWVYLSKNGHGSNKRSEVHTGDVLIVRSGYPGIACVVTEEFNNSNAIDILIAVPNPKTITSSYLCCFTNSPAGRKLVLNNKRGVAQSHLNVSGYSSIKIPVPSLAEQERIVAEIETRFERADAMELAVQNALDTAEKLKQAILKKAFRGELVPQNPNDEPASVLLERIRAARDSELSKSKRGKK